MKALVISTWGLCTTEGEVRLQVPLNPMEGDLIIQRYDQRDWRVRLLQCSHSLKGAQQVRGQGRRWDFRGVIDPLLSQRESIGRKRGRGGGECKGKLQYQDKAEGQRLRNFIRSVSMDSSSR
ncbi:hypothetical protein B296_00034059 [Ensete ventricosum]|uniref:Uncharacterized protein n=1 Tax=Ensete ventricosum TaxID=4639 RepID=A0A426XPA0_ENSVE|nr:hypothetical protein B296_00034059 [Ensete ventricosum]